MILVTGGAGFIGYNLVLRLVELGYKDIVIVDNNLERLKDKCLDGVIELVSYEDSQFWISFLPANFDVVFHLGARTDTMEKDDKIFDEFNVKYSKFIWNYCVDRNTPLIYASSAAVYGDGKKGFDDSKSTFNLEPLNEYGLSKSKFDLWASGSAVGHKLCSPSGGINRPPFWAGMRFFNVYGNHENHKGKMASVIWHLYNQIKETGEVKLFKSHVDDCKNGEQQRDFISVNDVVNVLIKMYEGKSSINSGIYNLGTGVARTYNDLAKEIFSALGKTEKISYIDTPIEIRDSYQYFTKAKMDKLLGEFDHKFIGLEEGIESYIKELENESC